MRENIGFTFFISVFLYRFALTSGMYNGTLQLLTGKFKLFAGRKQVKLGTGEKEMNFSEPDSVEKVKEKSVGEYHKICIKTFTSIYLVRKVQLSANLTVRKKANN